MFDFCGSSVGWSRLSRPLAGAVLAAALLFGINTSAQAAPVVFNMSFVETGAGEIGTGSLSVDSLFFTGIGAETLNPITGFLSFNVNIFGFDFSIGDDLGFPTFPTISFSNGTVTSIDYTGEIFADFNSETATVIDILGLQFLFDDGGFQPPLAFSAGSFTSGGNIIVTQVSAIPLPASLPLFLTGLAGLGYASRRRRLSRA